MKKLLHLPEHYDLVVGDTFELFYKGITYCVTSDVYDYVLRYDDKKNRGKAFARKYVFTPTEEDIGTHTLYIAVYDNTGEVIERGSVEIRVVDKPKSQVEERTILLIGDSLTGPGIWPAELGRRLLSTGGTPEGDGLMGVRFIGSKERDGIPYEGYGGWDYVSYTTDYKRGCFMILSGDFRDKKEETDRHSMWRDEAGALWKLEWITATEMKVIATHAATKLPDTKGRLTHVSGGMNTADIVFTDARHAHANPFFNVEKGENDFHAYVERFGAKRIDEVVILLGWNHHSPPDDFLTLVRPLLDSILGAFPDCHIGLVGLQIPSRDGFAVHYGIAWPWFSKLDKVFSYEDAYRSLTAEPPYAGRVSVISLAGQYDTVNNSVTVEMPLNNRNPKTEPIQCDGVHCAATGYLQIADAVYRYLATRLQ